MPDRFVRILKLLLAYDGTDYAGWQRQPNGVSIQQLVEEALGAFMPGAPAPVITGASRTDAGVHATGQVASVHVPFDHPVDAVLRGMNIRLPGAIRVMHVTEAAPGFHARRDARGKRYRYRIHRGAVVPPADRWFVWHVPGALDVEAMRQASRLLVGTHDFAAFQATGSSVVDTRRTVARIDLVGAGDELQIAVEGEGFLRHMIRIITGSLVDIGVGTRRPDWLAEALQGRDRRRAGRTAPAAGLCLECVRYDEPQTGAGANC